MSVLFTTITKDAVLLCADKLAANRYTGEAQKMPVNKIERWSPTLAIGSVGTMNLCRILVSSVHSYVKDGGFESFSLEEITDAFAQCYYAAYETVLDMPVDARAEIIVAGRRPNGKLAVAQIMVSNNEADVEVYEANESTKTLICAPADMTHDECYFKAVGSVNKKSVGQAAYMEAVHRQAVKYVAEKSAFVGPQSDCVMIEANIRKKKQR